jgi:hypothetical protein
VSESYEVDASALTGHARRLNGLADELRSVVDTVAVSLPDDAFGETARPAAVALNGLGQIGQETVRAGVEGLESESSKVRNSAIAYEQQETGAKAMLAEAGGGLGAGARPVDPEIPTS